VYLFTVIKLILNIAFLYFSLLHQTHGHHMDWMLKIVKKMTSMYEHEVKTHSIGDKNQLNKVKTQIEDTESDPEFKDVDLGLDHTNPEPEELSRLLQPTRSSIWMWTLVSYLFKRDLLRRSDGTKGLTWFGLGLNSGSCLPEELPKQNLSNIKYSRLSSSEVRVNSRPCSSVQASSNQNTSNQKYTWLSTTTDQS